MTPRIAYRFSILVFTASLALVAAGCMPRFLINAATPDVVVVSAPSAQQVTATGGDAHFILVDDYFVMEQALAGQDFVFAALGKMLTAPGPNTNNQARFRRILDNQELWSTHYAKTRLARTADYILNQTVWYPNYQDSFGNYRAPESDTEARSGWWMQARISDISELHKGWLTVTGGYRVNLNALRVTAL